MRLSRWLLASVMAVAAFPASAPAEPTLSIESTCFRPGEFVDLHLAGFEPNSFVALEYRGAFLPHFSKPLAPFVALGVAEINSQGIGGTTFVSEEHSISGSTETRLRFFATDYVTGEPVAQVDSKQTVFHVEWGFGEGRPPNESQRLLGYGFTAGERLYVHRVRQAGGNASTREVAVLEQPCGTITTSLPRFASPNPAPGRWRLQLDASPTFHRRTRPNVHFALDVRRRNGRSRIVSERWRTVSTEGLTP